MTIFENNSGRSDRELTNFAGIGNDPIINSDGRDIESGELVVPPGGKKSKTYCCTLIKTPWQCVPGVGTCAGVTVALLGTIILVANQLINMGGPNQQAVTVDTILGAGLIVLGAVVVITSCGDCCLIRHFKPEKDLEGQLDDFERENAKLKVENQGLNINVKRLDGLLEGYKMLEKRQEQIKDELKGLFDDKISALSFQKQELELIVKNYEKKVEQGLKDFNDETQQAKDLSAQLMNSNKALRERLQQLNVNVDGLAAQEEEWEKDLGKLSSANDAFGQHNFELQRLGKVMQNQLAVIKQLTEALSAQKEDITIQANRLDEFDDKFVGAAKDLLKIIEEKNKELEEAKLLIAQLTGAMAKFRSAIYELQKIDLSKVDSCDGLFQPLLKILDEVSESSHDSISIEMDE